MVRSKWKCKFIKYSLLMKILKNKNRTIIRTKSRSSTILNSFIGLTIYIYNGKRFNKLIITEKMVGYKLGEFAFTRKLGNIHKIKK